jgi:hypothetical protein
VEADPDTHARRCHFPIANPAVCSIIPASFDWIMEGLLERAGFEIVSRFADFPQCIAYVCRAG